MPPKTDFTKQAQKELDALVDERDGVKRKLDQLNEQITALSMYVSSTAPTADFGHNITFHPPTVVISGFRGEKITAVLNIIKNAPMALDIDAIIALAAKKDIKIDKASLRSQLAKAEAKGAIEKRGTLYFYRYPKEQEGPP